MRSFTWRAPISAMFGIFLVPLPSGVCSDAVQEVRNIYQGNVINSEKLEKLLVGMSRDQVAQLFGESLLPTPLDKDYIYYATILRTQWKHRLGSSSARTMTLKIKLDQDERVQGWEYKEYNKQGQVLKEVVVGDLSVVNPKGPKKSEGK